MNEERNMTEEENLPKFELKIEEWFYKHYYGIDDK